MSKKIILISTVFLLFAVFFSFDVSTSNAQYNASDVLGQVNANGDGVFTTGNPNNSQNNTPNKNGYAGLSYTVMDQTHRRLFVSDQYRVKVYNLDSSNNLIDRIPDNVIGKADFTTPYGYWSVPSINNFDRPLGLAYDAINNRLFVSNSNRVSVFDVTTITDGMDASFVLGQPDFDTNTATTTATGLSAPRGLVYDSANNRLFVADTGNHRVMVFDTSTLSNNMPASNVLGQADFTSKVSATTASGMNSPYGLALDSFNHRLFVSDYNNNRVMVYDITAISDNMDASFFLGQANATSNAPATTQSGMKKPFDVAYDSPNSRLFVSDSNNYRVLVFSVPIDSVSNGMNASYVLGQTDFTSGSNQGVFPSQNKFGKWYGTDRNTGLFYDSPNSRLFVSDPANYRMLIFSVPLGSVSNGMNASDVLGQLDESGNPDFTKGMPYGVPDGISLGGFENAGAVFGVSSYSSPNHYGTALDKNGHRLFVADHGNNRVLVFNLDANNIPIDRVADYVLGQGDLNQRQESFTASQSNIARPHAVVFDAVNNRLFVADKGNYRVLVFDVATITNGMNASYVLGQPDFDTRVQSRSQSLTDVISDIAYDSENSRLFVSDPWNSRVLIFDVAPGTIASGMNASYVLGQSTFGASEGGLTQGKFGQPYALAYDSNETRLFVSDESYNRVMIFSVPVGSVSNGMNASYVLGQANFTSSNPSITQKGLNGPVGLALDSSSNRLFVNDHDSNRVMIFDVSPETLADNIDAEAVLGQTSFTASTNGVTQSRIYNNTGGTVDETNRLYYLSDNRNNRILLYKFITLPATFTAGAVATPYSYDIAPINAQGTVAYTLVSGTLPPGLTLDGGTISGTPTTVGEYSFTMQATDTGSWGVFHSPVTTITLTIGPEPVVTPPPSTGGSSGGGSSKKTKTPSTDTVCPQGHKFSAVTGLPCTTFTSSQTPGSSVVLQPSGPSACSITLTLRQGSKGEQVKCLQAKLHIPSDGIFGPITRESVILFQKAHFLAPDGIVGPKTRGGLNLTD